jgi:hypothetical protein
VALLVAEQAVRWLAGYAAIGALCALIWLTAGMLRRGAASTPMSWPARLLLLPGQMLLWPWLCWRWLRSRSIL